MSSIVTRSTGNREIQFTFSGRKALRLGKASMKDAATAQIHVDNLLMWRNTGRAVQPATMDWLTGLSDEIRQRVEGVGLIDPVERREAPTLSALADGYISKRKDVKAGTLTVYGLSRQRLVKHFGADRRINTITAGHAEDFYQKMIGEGLAEATARKTISHGKQWFGYAVRHGWIARNPFEGMASHVRENPDRLRFISREDIAKVIDAAPDIDWKLIFALARFAGLRTPSETFALTWGDIDWSGKRITVRSPKTEHHEGHGERIIPLFPELAPLLQKAFDEAPEGAVHVVRWRDTATNLRTHALRIIRRAGLEPWPKPFHNLRSTRQTELAEQFPIQCVCAWIGNSTEIARKHYLQVTDAHYAKATAEAQQNAQQTATAKPCQPVTSQKKNRDVDETCGFPAGKDAECSPAWI
ncbi:MAG: site-specific integrase [Phycisphaerales bacterium]